MKFSLQYLNTSKGRLGLISHLERLPDLQLETPVVFLYTKAGSIPHITPDVLEMISKEVLGLQFPLYSIYHTRDAVENYKNGLSSFVGLPEHLSFCTLRDYAVNVPDGNHRQTQVAVWSRQGSRFIDAESYMDLMEAFQPDIYVSLSDGCTTIKSRNKRNENSVERTENFFNQCLERHQNSSVLKNRTLIGAVEGGYDLSLRKVAAKFLSSKPVGGFLIDGLYIDASAVESMDFNPVQNVIRETLNHLPSDKLRIVCGPWKPKDVLKMVKLGVDVFDTTLAFAATERGSALNFPYDFKALSETESNTSDSKTESEEIPSSYEITLYDKRYFDSFLPLVEGCSCLTCSKYTRSYIHHLLTTREMLGPVLLMIHNIHYYLEFFKGIREYLRNSYSNNMVPNEQ